MKLESVDDRVQVLDSQSDVWSVIRKIAESGVQEDAFYICDVGDIVRKHIHWRNLMPRVETHYAVKCNDSRIVLEVLAALGTGFDCASKEEIKKVMALGVSQERIIFANPTKPVSHIQHAQQFGVDLMTFDNKMELKKIKELYPNAKMVIRIKYDDTKAKYSFGKKFGCDAITEAPELLKTARSLGINVVGVSFHIGSGGKGNAAVYMGAIAAARHVFDVAADLGYKLQLLDIGGGYPGEHGTSITEIANCVNTAIELYFPDPSVKIIAEPGRYYVSSAFTLATNIHSTREVDIDTPLKIKQQMYYVNAGVYGALISTVFIIN